MAEEIDAYIFTAAENAEDAGHQVECWLEDSWDQEFYRKFDVKREDVQAVLDMNEAFFSGKRFYMEDFLQRQREEVETARADGDRNTEGNALKVVSEILLESMCPSMPWFNSETYDWQVPASDDEKHLMGQDRWYAVMVKFFY